ncbi:MULTISPECIES: hypothetical protein [Silvimonas]|uniref:hypothetical protein n=1 Tax=Silvimonas TaxID=300264 RepID=UPI0024B396D9|nr:MULTISPECIES: hypothetical protein [Silvimonas]MDR3429208.1 hypothetical protein [Silvimonas sp.]
MRHLAFVALLLVVVIAGCAVPANDAGNASKIASAPTPTPTPVVTPTPTPTPVPAKPVKRKPAKNASAASQITGKPAAGSKFSMLRIGMTRHQVEALIGLPGDVKTTQLKNGGTRDETFYQHEGVLSFSKNGTVLAHISVDTAANGYQ